MIVFDLTCHPAGHRFEGWFGSSDDFAAQSERGLVTCPQCGSPVVAKAPMAPTVGRKGNQMPAAAASKPPASNVVGGEIPPQMREAMANLARMQAEALSQSRWVGPEFARQSREMHYGDREVETIHGQASLDEARDLLEEGVAVMPLPFPVAPPDEIN